MENIVAEVCVGMSVYKQTKGWLQESIQSIADQTFSAWSLIIRLDGPEALDWHTTQWIIDQASSDSRIRLVIGNRRLGTFGSYASIFNGCEQRYLVQLDADDRLGSNGLEEAVSILEQFPDAPFLYTQARLIGPCGELGGIEPRSLRTWQPNLDLVQFLYFHMRLVRSSAYARVGGYDGSFDYTGDYDLSLKLAELGKPIYLPRPLYEYRLHTNSASQVQRRCTHVEACRASRTALQRRGLNHQYQLVQSPIAEVFSLEARKKTPLAVVGLHRCGTSLLSRLLQALHVSFGDSLIAADRDQPDGYLESTTLVALHRSWFSEYLSAAKNGWVDWGWTPNESVGCLGKRRWKADAHNWLTSFLSQLDRVSDSAQASQTLAYGFKDPRLTLLLPFWNEFIPELKVIGIYRTPWDFGDAVNRLSHPLFRKHPEIILPIWKLYNTRLVEYAQAKPENSVIVHAESLAAQPENLKNILSERWDWQWSSDLSEDWAKSLIDDARLPHLKADDPIAGLYAAVFPDIFSTLIKLQEYSDLPFAGLRSPEHESPLYRRPPKARLSIIIPTFNPCQWLIESIASIYRFAPDIGSIEILIIDDGSTDLSSLQILGRLQTCGFEIIHQPNCGLSAARNAGFRASRAPLVLPLDDDNRLLSPYLTEGIRLMEENQNIGFTYGERLDFGARFQHFKPGQISLKELQKANRVDACALIRKDLWVKNGGYDPTLKALEDWDFWLSAASIGVNAGYIQQPCFEYRVREDSMLHSHLRNTEQHRETIAYMAAKHKLPIELLV